MQQLIDGLTLGSAFVAGYRNLKNNMAAINDLNVFPVPDGDTGTNMVHTFGGALDMTSQSENVGVYMQGLANATLLCARGNSGVIFSQFVYGLSLGMQKKEIAFADFAEAFRRAQEEAYKAIITPTEGTILTVIREAADYLEEKADTFADFQSGMDGLLTCMKASLERTPELLPVLKQAGVVDSGGAGLVCFFEGIHAYFCGNEPEDVHAYEPTKTPVQNNFGPDSVMEYGYCTEFILQLMHAKTDISAFSKDEFVAPLMEMGDSLVAVANGSIVKIHIHTFAPEQVIAYARRFGELVTVKIENMSVQHSETEMQAEKPKEKVKYSVVAVAQGQGIADYFYEIGTTVVIDGGQTNNPPVEAFLEAFDKYDAENIIVLPNNSNIILTANQAAKLYNKSNVYVLPTKTIVEGNCALSMMNLWNEDAQQMIADMQEGLENVISASVTTATRDVVMDGVQVVKDNYIGIKGKEILVCDADRFSVAKELVDTIVGAENSEVIIVFYGKAVEETEAEAFKAYLEEKYPLADIGFICGQQEIYDYIISLE